MDCDYGLVARNVCRKQGGFRLNNISFSLEKGYIMGLVGRMGCGKTTLLKTILNPGLAGGRYADGRSIGGRKADGRCVGGNAGNGYTGRRHTGGIIRYEGQAGFIMEDAPFLWTATITENADTFGCLYENYDSAEFEARLAEVELSGYKQYGHLSKGEKVRFQFAFAMAHHPKLLLLDEPTSGLDVTFRRKFLYMVQEAVEKDMVSVIIATHLIEDLEKVADYIGVMENGSLTAFGTRDEVAV